VGAPSQFNLFGFPRPHRRGRIETALLIALRVARTVSPGLTAGGGLKPRIDGLDHGLDGFPPASPPGAD